MTSFKEKWLFALNQVFPIYIIVHAVFALLTFFSALFALNNFSTNSLPLHFLLQSWYQWDSGNYTAIAQHGYQHHISLAAFFPLFPLLERIGSYVTHSPYIAGLIISNIANLLMLVVLYQLVREDFDYQCARRAALYISIFPSAFFFAAAYTESLFLCLILLTFYQMRHSRWWLAGFFNFLACLLRSAGIFLLFPLAYEYLRRKQIRFSVLSIALVPTGLAAYSWFCYRRFGDPLAWEHAQTFWHHQFMPPWNTLLTTLQAIRQGPGLLSFQGLHNCLDLTSILFVLMIMILMCFGPWRLHREQLSYTVYALPLCLFLLSVPIISDHAIPLQSVPRYMLEIFPVFIVAGNIGKHRWFHEAYVLISGALLFLSCTLFLTGHWMV